MTKNLQVNSIFNFRIQQSKVPYFRFQLVRSFLRNIRMFRSNHYPPCGGTDLVKM